MKDLFRSQGDYPRYSRSPRVAGRFAPGDVVSFRKFGMSEASQAPMVVFRVFGRDVGGNGTSFLTCHIARSQKAIHWTLPINDPYRAGLDFDGFINVAWVRLGHTNSEPVIIGSIDEREINLAVKFWGEIKRPSVKGRAGEVIGASVCFSGTEGHKSRPVVVVRDMGDRLLCCGVSRTSERYGPSMKIYDQATAGLDSVDESYIRLLMVTTIPARHAGPTIGRLGEDDLACFTAAWSETHTCNTNCTPDEKRERRRRLDAMPEVCLVGYRPPSAHLEDAPVDSGLHTPHSLLMDPHIQPATEPAAAAIAEAVATATPEELALLDGVGDWAELEKEEPPCKPESTPET